MRLIYIYIYIAQKKLPFYETTMTCILGMLFNYVVLLVRFMIQFLSLRFRYFKFVLFVRRAELYSCIFFKILNVIDKHFHNYIYLIILYLLNSKPQNFIIFALVRHVVWMTMKRKMFFICLNTY